MFRDCEFLAIAVSSVVYIFRGSILLYGFCSPMNHFSFCIPLMRLNWNRPVFGVLHVCILACVSFRSLSILRPHSVIEVVFFGVKYFAAGDFSPGSLPNLRFFCSRFRMAVFGFLVILFCFPRTLPSCLYSTPLYGGGSGFILGVIFGVLNGRSILSSIYLV